jgi:hypothetical protein
MVYAGFSHLTLIELTSGTSTRLVPLSKDLVLSGIVEMALGLGLAFGKTTSHIWLDTIFVLVFPLYCAILDHKDAFGALNSDNARLIRLFSNRTDRLGFMVSRVIKPGEIVKLNNNMDDAQLKLSVSLFPAFTLLPV